MLRQIRISEHAELLRVTKRQHATFGFGNTSNRLDDGTAALLSCLSRSSDQLTDLLPRQSFDSCLCCRVEQLLLSSRT
jgi:hypothetical protein